MRRRAVEVLYMLGSKARPVLSELDRALDGPDKAMRVLVGDVLMRVDPDASRERVIAALTGLLQEKSVRLEHHRLIRVLKNAQGEEATAAMLVQLLKDPNVEVRLMAVYDLREHCANAPALRPAMLAAFAGADLTLREEAAFYLLKHEPAKKDPALDLLADQTANPGEGSYLAWDLVKRTREAAPGSMKPFAARLVAQMGAAPRPNGLLFVIAALGEIGPEAAASVPALLELSASRDLKTATRAVEALVKIDPQRTATKIDSLLEWISPGHESAIRLGAMASLRDLRHLAADAIPALLKLADEEDLAISAARLKRSRRLSRPPGTL